MTPSPTGNPLAPHHSGDAQRRPPGPASTASSRRTTPPQPVQAQHETVSGASAAPFQRRGQELVLRPPPSPRDPWGRRDSNEPVIVRLSQGRHEGRLVCLMRTGREKPHLPGPFRPTKEATWSQAQPLRWQYSRWGKWRGHRGRRPGPDRDARRHPGGQLRTTSPTSRTMGSSWPSAWTRGTPGTQVTRLAHGTSPGPTPRFARSAPASSSWSTDKRDEYYTSPLAPDLRPNHRRETTVNSGWAECWIVSTGPIGTRWAPVVRQRCGNASGRRRGLDGAAGAIWRTEQ